MKTIYLLLILLGSFVNIHAQVPNQFAFQGVARNAANQPVANQTVSVRFTLRQGSESGTSVYQETHSPQTTAAGIFNVSVGAGNATTSSFSAINWNAGPYFLQVELDVAGGSNYVTVSITQLQSVPYALAAKNLEGVADPQNGDVLEYQNGAWTQKPKPKRYYVRDLGLNPSSTLGFIGATATITIERDNPTIAIHLSKILGSFNAQGGGALSIGIGYRKTGGSIEKFYPDDHEHLHYLKVSSGTKWPVFLSGSFATTFKAGETYEIGLVATSSVASTWNDNGRGEGYVEVSY